MRARVTRDDSGQMMAALVIGLCMTLLAFLVVALVPLGAATNDKTRSQTAADAAALAAADSVRRHWVGVATSVPGLRVHTPAGGRPPGLGLGLGSRGQPAAEQYARENGAVVVGYQAAPGRRPFRVTVDVENGYSSLEDSRYSGTGPARSTATAEMDAAFSRCSWSPRPPGPTLESTPPGPPTYTATLTCGDWAAEYEVHNSSALGFGLLRRITGDDALIDQLEPRLVE